MRELSLSALLGFVALGLAGCEDPEAGEGLAAGERPMTHGEARSRVVLLGTGTPHADPERSGPATAIVVDGVPYLIDFGPGVVRRAAAARLERGVEGLAVQNLRTAFVTHLHSDHTAGYPDLILTPWVLDRRAPLEVYGPIGLRAMTGHLLEAYREDIEVRVRGLEPREGPPRVNVHEIGEGESGPIYRDERVRVSAFRVPHGSWEHAFGYRFETPDRTIVISGDTGPFPEIADHCAGCDLLIHEVYSTKGFAGRAPEWRRYHASFHTSSSELARIAARARPGRLVLYHQLLWGASPEELVAEIREAGYEGSVSFGRDLDIF